ncbi:hypothetical protein C8R45DRAFT_1013232 [Mycena sanguinolenta]|nr:hypothetical protein C8R45DRAFT_1013232 [Mycena sanguinolenta]
MWSGRRLYGAHVGATFAAEGFCSTSFAAPPSLRLPISQIELSAALPLRSSSAEGLRTCYVDSAVMEPARVFWERECERAVPFSEGGGVLSVSGADCREGMGAGTRREGIEDDSRLFVAAQLDTTTDCHFRTLRSRRSAGQGARRRTGALALLPSAEDSRLSSSNSLAHVCALPRRLGTPRRGLPRVLSAEGLGGLFVEAGGVPVPTGRAMGREGLGFVRRVLRSPPAVYSCQKARERAGRQEQAGDADEERGGAVSKERCGKRNGTRTR